MVKRDSPLYLFVGEDTLSKEVRLKKLKEELLTPNTQDFNLDILYAGHLGLRTLQEKILAIPLKSKQRIVVIKEAQNLTEDLKKFLLKYAQSPHSSVAIVLDINKASIKDQFIKNISRYTQTIRFKDNLRLDTFSLSRQIEMRKMDSALRVLNQLLKEGEKPERILGGLRYVWERSAFSPLEAKKKLRCLINCDIDIKTGRLKPDFALEKLVISLCGFSKPLG